MTRTRARQIIPLLLFGISAWGSPAAAQFHVKAALPSNGTTDVPIESIVRFEFNKAVSTANDFARAFVVHPREAITITQVALLVPDLSRPAGPDNPPSVVEFTVTHRADTDYTWLVYAIQSAGGEYMTSPHTLRYTTAAHSGALTVAGALQPADAASSPPASLAAHHFVRGVYEGLTEPLSPSADVLQSAAAVSATHSSSSNVGRTTPAATSLAPHTQVLLLDTYNSDAATWRVRAAGVVEGTSGSYTIEGVRPGTYWPVAVRYTGAPHLTVEALGYYDRDGDLAPDSLVLNGNASDIDMAVFPFAPATARSQLAAARAAVDTLGYDPAPLLQLVDSEFGTRPDGTAYGWSYRFYSGRADTLITALTDPLGVTLSQRPATSTQERIVSPVPDEFIDSDQALAIALDEGGAAVIERYPPENVTVTALGGNRHWLLPEYDPTPFWDIRLLAASPDGLETFEIRVDMATGEAFAVDAVEVQPPPLRLGQAYPNPARSTTSIPFVLDQTGQVELSVFDLLGRRVATLVHRAMPAGSHEERWDVSAVPSGVYTYTLVVDGERTSGRVVVAH